MHSIAIRHTLRMSFGLGMWTPKLLVPYKLVLADGLRCRCGSSTIKSEHFQGGYPYMKLRYRYETKAEWSLLPLWQFCERDIKSAKTSDRNWHRLIDDCRRRGEFTTVDV